MAIHGIDHFNIRASCEVIDELKAFYQNVLGLELGPRPAFATQGYWLYADDRPFVHLTVMRDGEHRPLDVASTFDHVAFTCTDFDRVEACLKANKVRYVVDAVPGLGHRQIFFSDPAGNGIELNFAPVV